MSQVTTGQIASGRKDSPFSSPGVQFAWDSTSLGLYKECPRKYYYAMICGWRRPGPSVHLDFGGLYHSALGWYDHKKAEGFDHETALHSTVTWLMLETWTHERDENGLRIPGTGRPLDWGDETTKNRYTLVRSVIWYLEHFSMDPAKTLILENGKPAVELSFRFDAGEGRLLCGHLDRVVEYNGAKFVMDRKTSGSTISSYYFDKYAPDNQMSLYTLAGQMILQSPVAGVVIDAVQIAVNFSRFERGMTYRSAEQLEEWLHDFHVWADRANMDGEGAFQHEAPEEQERYFIQNDKSCHVYGGCQFRDICSSSPRVRQTFLESNYERREWNPLIPR